MARRSLIKEGQTDVQMLKAISRQDFVEIARTFGKVFF
jgi:hypothetical protein